MGTIRDQANALFADTGLGTPSQARSLFGVVEDSIASAGNLATEVTNRTNADAALLTELHNEETARANGDSALSTALAAEATSRADGDNALSVQLATETTARTNAISAEATARTNADATLTNNLAVLTTTVGAKAAQSDLAALTSTVTAETTARIVGDTAGMSFLASDARPGDCLYYWSESVSGAPLGNAPIDPQYRVASGASGTVYRRGGAWTLAARRATWLEPGRTFALRFRFSRFVTPTDPAGDAIICGIAYLDGNFNLISTATVREFDSVTATLGVQALFATVPSLTGAPITVTPPAGTVYFRPFFRTYGPDGVTDLIEISASDITDLSVYAPDISTLQSQIASLTAQVAALNPLQAGTPNGLATLNVNGNLVQLPLSKAKVMAEMLVSFASISGASFGQLAATISGPEAPGADYFAWYMDRDAPRNGVLYNVVLAYLQSASPGPALSSSAAAAATTAIWNAAVTDSI